MQYCEEMKTSGPPVLQENGIANIPFTHRLRKVGATHGAPSECSIPKNENLWATRPENGQKAQFILNNPETKVLKTVMERMDVKKPD
jgi:hypothetical protein